MAKILKVLLQGGVRGIDLHEGLRVGLERGPVVTDPLLEGRDPLLLERDDRGPGADRGIHPEGALPLTLRQEGVADPDRQEVELEGVVDHLLSAAELVKELQCLLQIPRLGVEFGKRHGGLHGEIVADASRDHGTDHVGRLGRFALLGNQRRSRQTRSRRHVTAAFAGLGQGLLRLGLASRLVLDLGEGHQRLGLVLPLGEFLEAPVVVVLRLLQVLLVVVGGPQGEEDRLQGLARRSGREDLLEILRRARIIPGLKRRRPRLEEVFRRGLLGHRAQRMPAC